MALCESSNRRLRKQNALSKIVVFVPANTSDAGGKTAKHYTVKLSIAIIRNLGVRTNHFELLMLKHDRTYSVYDFRREYVCDSEM